MAFPTITNTLTSGTTAIEGDWNTNFSDLTSGLTDASHDIKINNFTANSNVSITNDIYTSKFASVDLTVYGWDTYTTKKIYQKKIGKTVYIYFEIDGTALTSKSAGETYFVLTYPYNYYFTEHIRVISVTSYYCGNITAYSPPNSYAMLYRDYIGSGFSAGRKYCCGQFSYETY